METSRNLDFNVAWLRQGIDAIGKLRAAGDVVPTSDMIMQEEAKVEELARALELRSKALDDMKEAYARRQKPLLLISLR